MVDRAWTDDLAILHQRVFVKMRRQDAREDGDKSLLILSICSRAAAFGD